jgi:hypothetical protein
MGERDLTLTELRTLREQAEQLPAQGLS